MGQQQSREELLFQEVNYRNINGIKDLHRAGVSLECVNREGITPLIAACMNPELYGVAKTLIELGANVNAFCPGRNGGTPLHFAAKRGLEHTVELLMLHGANALLMNDGYQTPLDIARAKGFTKVVRMIEGHICLFSGWLRELFGPSILELLAPQFLSRKVWAIVVPYGTRNLQKPFKLELAIYDRLQDAQPRMTIALWKAKMEDPTFNQHELAIVIAETAGIPRRRRRRRCRPRQTRQAYIKLAPQNERDKTQFQQFCDACKGIPQVMHTAFPFNAPATFAPATITTSKDDIDLAMALSASLQSAMEEGVPVGHTESSSGAMTSSHVASSSVVIPSHIDAKNDHASSSVSHEIHPQISEPSPPSTSASPIPSAPPPPPLALDDGRIQYPSIELDPEPEAEKTVTIGSGKSVIIGSEKKGEEQSSSCVVCLDAPVEGACVPCGHMAGCMSCLEEIKEKKWGCPICRSKIDQIIRTQKTTNKYGKLASATAGVTPPVVGLQKNQSS
ncbi:hypothetical protein V2J09_006062 [Rumex salicifolius]